jgi:hypothetical protein
VIKIVSGWTNPGGSTVAFINLVNALNQRGYECKMFGPHGWFRDKCPSGEIKDAGVTSQDYVISHFCNLSFKTKPKKHILSLHERELFSLANVNIANYDKIHFVSENQMKWHASSSPAVGQILKQRGFICPNVLDDLKKTVKPKMKAAGIIGSIDRNKQTHISIQNALRDGFKEIKLFGTFTDRDYFNREVKPLIDANVGVVKIMGYEVNKQKMYDQISHVYLSSKAETWSFIKLECELTGREFIAPKWIDSNHTTRLSNDEIVNTWIEKLEYGKD